MPNQSRGLLDKIFWIIMLLLIVLPMINICALISSNLAEKSRIHPFVLNNLGTWFLDAHPGYEEQVLQLALRFVLSCPQV